MTLFFDILIKLIQLILILHYHPPYLLLELRYLQTCKKHSLSLYSWIPFYDSNAVTMVWRVLGISRMLPISLIKRLYWWIRLRFSHFPLAVFRWETWIPSADLLPNCTEMSDSRCHLCIQVPVILIDRWKSAKSNGYALAYEKTKDIYRACLCKSSAQSKARCHVYR